MNIKLRAALEMGKMLTVGIVISAVIGLAIQYINDPQKVAYAIGFACLGYVFYTLYQITLSRLEYEEKLKETVDTFKQ